MQSAIARGLTDIPLTVPSADGQCMPGTLAYRGRWWYEDEMPALRLDAEGLGILALAMTRDRYANRLRDIDLREGDPLRWKWISTALARVRQQSAEARTARLVAAEGDVARATVERVELVRHEPSRLLETYLRLEVARLALEPIIGQFATHDRGWRARHDAVPATPENVRERNLVGPVDEVNNRHRLSGRALRVTAGAAQARGVTASNGHNVAPSRLWAAKALAVDPAFTAVELTPWDERLEQSHPS